MYLFAIVTVALAVCIIVNETKERTASLVVLPPLVLGYDELYNDSEENKDVSTTEAPKEAKEKSTKAPKISSSKTSESSKLIKSSNSGKPSKSSKPSNSSKSSKPSNSSKSSKPSNSSKSSKTSKPIKSSKPSKSSNSSKPSKSSNSSKSSKSKKEVQRTMIDTRGRRRNYRRLLREKRKPKPIFPSPSQYLNIPSMDRLFRYNVRFLNDTECIDCLTSKQLRRKINAYRREIEMMK